MGLLHPSLTVQQILAWADDHHTQTGAWPITTMGTVLANPKEIWRTVDVALGKGLRKLPKGSSLAKPLAIDRATLLGRPDGPLGDNSAPGCKELGAACHQTHRGRRPYRRHGRRMRVTSPSLGPGGVPPAAVGGG